MEDHKIIDLYWARSQQAIVESDQKYGPYCRAIALGILAMREDAEECVNDTWLRAWEAMLDFTREAAKYVPEVVMTIVDKDKSPEEIAACRALCEGLGARFRVRSYIED